jgi:hypothetical protein
MITIYTLLFYLKKPKNYESGPMPIYMRITVDGLPKRVLSPENVYLSDGGLLLIDKICLVNEVNQPSI